MPVSASRTEAGGGRRRRRQDGAGLALPTVNLSRAGATMRKERVGLRLAPLVAMATDRAGLRTDFRQLGGPQSHVPPIGLIGLEHEEESEGCSPPRASARGSSRLAATSLAGSIPGWP